MAKFKKLALLCTAILACGTMAVATGCEIGGNNSSSESSTVVTPSVTKYTIKFVNDDGTVLQEGEVEEGVLPEYAGETPTKAATAQHTYTFSGWDKTIVEASENVVYTATYTSTINKYTLTFDTDGGTAIEDMEVEYGTSAEALSQVSTTKTGYTFAGWTLEHGTPIPENAIIQGNLTIKAKWDIITYTAKIVRANGTEETVNFTILDKAEKLAAIALTANDAQYTYSWKTALPTELELNNNQVFTEKRTVNTYTVTFNTDGGTEVVAKTVNYGKSVAELAQATTTKTGYAFVAWTLENGDAISETAIVEGDLTIKAKWDIITYTAKIVRANGTEETVNFTVLDKAEKLAAIALTANDAQYTYSWKTALPTELELNNNQVFTEERKVNTYTVTFNTDGGAEVTAQTVEYGTPASALSQVTTTKTGYNFMGWTFEDGSAIPETATIQGNVTVKAKWEAINYTITFVNYDGTELQSGEVAYDTMPAYTGDTPSKASDEYYNYVFAGWDKAIAMVTGEATYTATFTTEIRSELKGNAYTLSELGGTDGGIGTWGNQVLTMKDNMEGTFIYKMTKTGSLGNHIHSFNLFYDGANAGNGVRMTFQINANLNINGTTVSMNNVQPNVEYYYLISWKVAEDYSKVTVHIRVESTDGTAVLGDKTVELTTLAGAESIEAWVKANNKILIDAQQCSFSVASAWTLEDAAKFVELKEWKAAVESLNGQESYEDLLALKATYTAFAKHYQLLVDVAPLDEAIDNAEAALRGNAYTLSELGGKDGGIGTWGKQVLTMKDNMEGTFLYKMTKTGSSGTHVHSFTLFYDETTAENGVRMTFTINQGVKINGTKVSMGNVQPDVEYYYLISWKVADDYSKVTVRIRIESTDGTSVLGDKTVELTSLAGAESIEAWVKANNKILIDAQQCSFSVASAWTEFDVAKFTAVKNIETAISQLTGKETYQELSVIKAQYDAMEKAYQLLVDNYAAFETAYNDALALALRGNAYTLSELGGTDGGIGTWGNQVLTMKDSMEGTFIYKMTKTAHSGSHIHSFNLFYDGANAGNGVRMTFQINANLKINGTTVSMGNVQPNVEYYYLISWKVAEDYSKVTVRIRIEATDGTSVLGDKTVELTSLAGAESIEAWVKANNKILIDAQQCSFSVASAWTEFDAAKFEAVQNLEAAIAKLTGKETYQELKAIKTEYDKLGRAYQLLIDNGEAFEEAYNAVLEVALKDNTYTLKELGGTDGGIGTWGNQVLTMKNNMEGTFIYKMTKTGSLGNHIHSFNLFYDGANAGNGVRMTFQINANLTINGTTVSMSNVQPDVEYYYLISWKVAEDYSKVTVRIRVESTDGTSVLGDKTVELTSLIGAESIEAWVKANNKILIDAQQCTFSVASAWTELDGTALENVLNLEIAISELTGEESAETLNTLKAQYEAMGKAYQLMVDNYAVLDAAIKAIA